MARPDVADVIVIGAGPAGLFATFQLGIHGFSTLIIDSGNEIGGQLAALYADKPIYDMPAFGEVNAGDLAQLLLRQVERFSPVIRLASLVTAIIRRGEGFAVEMVNGESVTARHVIIATGLGPFGTDANRQTLTLPDGVTFDAGHLPVTTDGFSTSMPGIFAIGDAAMYPGKLCLLSSAFHEAALAAFAIRKARAGSKRVVLEYSSTSTAVRNRLG